MQVGRRLQLCVYSESHNWMQRKLTPATPARVNSTMLKSQGGIDDKELFSDRSVRELAGRSVSKSVSQSVSQSVNQSVRKSVRQSVSQSIRQLSNQTVIQSANQSASSSQ